MKKNILTRFCIAIPFLILSTALAACSQPTGTSIETLPAVTGSPAITASVTPTPVPTATPSPTATPEPTATPLPTPTPTPAPVTVCLAGDLLCLGAQQRYAEQPDGSYNFTESFSLIQDHLKRCDFAIANLETLISESAPLTQHVTYGETGAPHCNGPEEYLAAVKEAGFNVLCDCNNHTIDGGLLGISETIQKLNEYEFLHTGMYEAASEGTPEDTQASPERFLILEKNGIKIGLVAFTELINLRDQFKKEVLDRVINCYSKEFAEELIAKAKDAGADYIIAYNHWGNENTHDVTDRQRKHAQELANAGADLIIGSHPHCLQGIELLETTDGRRVPCYYSLGNLVSSMRREINNDTVLVTITLHNTPEGVRLKETELMPCHVIVRLDGKPHVIVPVSYELEKKTDQSELANAKKRIEEVLGLNNEP